MKSSRGSCDSRVTQLLKLKTSVGGLVLLVPRVLAVPLTPASRPWKYCRGREAKRGQEAPSVALAQAWTMSPLPSPLPPLRGLLRATSPGPSADQPTTFSLEPKPGSCCTELHCLAACRV